MDRDAHQRAADYVLVTEEMIESARTAAGGWRAAQLRLIGVSWPPAAGWKKRAVGRMISPKAVQLFHEWGRKTPTDKKAA